MSDHERMARLSRGDIIEANPCVVTITATVGVIAYGRCATCQAEHIIDRESFEVGKGPWRRVENGRTWTREQHDAECGNGGCPGFEFHRVRRATSGSTEQAGPR